MQTENLHGGFIIVCCFSLHQKVSGARNPWFEILLQTGSTVSLHDADALRGARETSLFGRSARDAAEEPGAIAVLPTGYVGQDGVGQATGRIALCAHGHEHRDPTVLCASYVQTFHQELLQGHSLTLRHFEVS